MTVGQKIKEIRRAKGISQKELSLQINKSESSLKKYENGEVAITVDVLLDISEVLDVNPCILLQVKEVDVLALLKHEYNLLIDNDSLQYDIDTYMKYLQFKYKDLQ